MTKNVGFIDQAVRLVTASVIVILFLMNIISGMTALVLGIVAGIFFLTAVSGSCPIYSVLGVSSKSGKSRKA